MVHNISSVNTLGHEILSDNWLRLFAGILNFFGIFSNLVCCRNHVGGARTYATVAHDTKLKAVSFKAGTVFRKDAREAKAQVGVLEERCHD